MALISASRTISADRDAAFAFLRDLDNHWRIAGPFVDVVALDGPVGERHGGVVRVRGPLGLRRTVRTRIVTLRAPEAIEGVADAGARTRARVCWRLQPQDAGGTLVILELEVRDAAPLDGALLALGGRPWLRRRLAKALVRLEQAMEPSQGTAPQAPWLAPPATETGRS